jgi:hypothetical protein
MSNLSSDNLQANTWAIMYIWFKNTSMVVYNDNRN